MFALWNTRLSSLFIFFLQNKPGNNKIEKYKQVLDAYKHIIHFVRESKSGNISNKTKQKTKRTYQSNFLDLSGIYICRGIPSAPELRSWHFPHTSFLVIPKPIAFLTRCSISLFCRLEI